MASKKLGVYLLPHLLTSMSLACGFFAISFAHAWHQAAIAIFLGMIFDVLDGKVARAMGVASEFGEVYDSLSDMVTFGLAPAFLMYKTHLYVLGRLGWILALFYVVASALRLARYNSMQTDLPGFVGLPSPAAAALLTGAVWSAGSLGWQPSILYFILITSGAASLMVSTLPYHGLKGGDLAKPFSLWMGLWAVFVLGLVWLEPASGLFFLFLAYALSGLLRESAQRWKRVHDQGK